MKSNFQNGLQRYCFFSIFTNIVNTICNICAFCIKTGHFRTLRIMMLKFRQNPSLKKRVFEFVAVGVDNMSGVLQPLECAIDSTGPIFTYLQL